MLPFATKVIRRCSAECVADFFLPFSFIILIKPSTFVATVSHRHASFFSPLYSVSVIHFFLFFNFELCRRQRKWRVALGGCGHSESILRKIATELNWFTRWSDEMTQILREKKHKRHETNAKTDVNEPEKLEIWKWCVRASDEKIT